MNLRIFVVPYKTRLWYLCKENKKTLLGAVKKEINPMRLDPDCVRNILMTVEETSSVDTVVSITPENYKDYQKLKEYEFAKLAYHIRQCELTGFFFQASCDYDFAYTILDLSPKAHDFLANIRDNTFWNKVKRKAAELGTTSLEMIPQIAAAMLQAQLTGLIG